MTFILGGKELVLDQQGRQEAKYPDGVPDIFRFAPIEDYRKEVCTYLCQYQSDISWESIYNYKMNTCDINDFGEVSMTKQESCSSDICRDKTAFASTNFYVEHLRSHETNLSVTQLQNINVLGNNTKIWIKSDASFYTVRKINVEKKFQEFLAEIGGNFGLFAGASILTLVEMGEFFIKILKKIFDKRPIGPTGDVERG